MEIKDATMANTQAIVRFEGHIGHLVTKFSIKVEKELQSQLMARRHFMNAEDDSSNSYHEYDQATTTPEREETANNNEEEEKDE